MENRTWPTSYRGRLGIHAGKSKAWLKTYSPLPGKMEFGGVVGFATLDYCVSIEILRSTALMKDRRIADFAGGPYCWIFSHVWRFLDPEEMPGKQGLFEVEDWHFERANGACRARCRICGCTE